MIAHLHLSVVKAVNLGQSLEAVLLSSALQSRPSIVGKRDFPVPFVGRGMEGIRNGPCPWSSRSWKSCVGGLAVTMERLCVFAAQDGTHQWPVNT